MTSDDVEQGLELARRMIDAGQWRPAEKLLADFVSQVPDEAFAWAYLGLVRNRLGEHGQAFVDLQRSTALRDDLAFAWSALADAAQAVGDIRQVAIGRWRAFELSREDRGAAAAFEEALSQLGRHAQALVTAGQEAAAESLFDLMLLLSPRDRRALHDKGVLLYRAKRYDVAIDLLRMADALQRTPVGMCNLGSALADSGQSAAALSIYNQCLAIFPDHAPAAYNAACTLAKLERLDAAEAMYRKAIALVPDYAEALNNLGSLCSDLGRHDEATVLYRRALAARPNYLQAYDNLMFGVYYLPETTGADLVAVARQWQDVCPLPAAPAVVRRRGERRLRIGYVSPDLRDHAVSYFLEPLLDRHDRERFELFCYSMVQVEDHVTVRMKGYGPHWRDVRGVDDQRLAELIRADGVDMLVDCVGHTKGNRMPAFTRRLAPVQVANHLGMAGTLGVPAITHFLSDPHISPPGHEAYFTETLVRLPRVFMPFRPRQEWPEISQRETGTPVFGCFAEPLRFSAPLVRAWQQIMEQVPNATLLLKHPRYANPRLRDHYRAVLGLGDRAQFEGIDGGWAKHWDVYRRVWVMLDSFPVTGATSTAIPLWMGTPVVSLAGSHAGQRFGVSMLANAGFPQWVAADMNAYVAIAVGLVQAPDELDVFRQAVRARMQASALLDEIGVVGEFEQALRTIYASAEMT